MKLCYFLIPLLIFGFGSVQLANSQYIQNDLSPSVKIEDGWYESIIKYRNSSTYTNSTYRLNVKVSYGKVTRIDFGNRGSVHDGYNNEGYTYNGGTLYE